MPDTAERLTQCFSAIFPELSPEEIRKASPASVAAWDSLATINIVNLVEEEFGIDLPVAELQEMGSFDLILDYLERTLPRD
jgi:acyl carrier protein